VLQQAFQTHADTVAFVRGYPKARLFMRADSLHLRSDSTTRTATRRGTFIAAHVLLQKQHVARPFPVSPFIRTIRIAAARSPDGCN
jgi:hypothetical protein